MAERALAYVCVYTACVRAPCMAWCYVCAVWCVMCVLCVCVCVYVYALVCLYLMYVCTVCVRCVPVYLMCGFTSNTVAQYISCSTSPYALRNLTKLCSAMATIPAVLAAGLIPLIVGLIRSTLAAMMPSGASSSMSIKQTGPGCHTHQIMITTMNPADSPVLTAQMRVQ